MDIKTIYNMGALAQASYAFFIGNNLITPLKNKGDFTKTEASIFVQNYSIKGGENGHLPNTTTSNFSATLFQNNENNNELTLAIRGTENIEGDLLNADIVEIGSYGIALKQTLDLYNYISVLKASSSENTVKQLSLQSYTDTPPPEGVDVLFTHEFEEELDGDYGTNNTPTKHTIYYFIEESKDGQGLGLINPGEKITVTGHSLGGHLSAVSSLLFPNLVEAAYLFNAPGFDREGSKKLTFDVIEAITGVRPSGFPASKLYSYEAETLLEGDDIDYDDELNTNEINGNWDYTDYNTVINGTPLSLEIDGNGLSFSDHQIIFGADAADTLVGSGDEDHLYGAKGNDTLNGNAGSDYIQSWLASQAFTFGWERNSPVPA